MKTKTIKSNFTRRDFMSTAGLGAVSMLTAVPIISCKSNSTTTVPIPKKDRPAAAVIGLGGRGRGIAAGQFLPYMDVIAVCDVDRRRAQAAAEDILKKSGRQPAVYLDYRKLLERKDIDIIGNATPEHWHVKITIDACRAGKDVYVEKPLALTIEESQIVKRVAEETGRIIQVGSQQRSGPHFQAVTSLVRNGRIGKLKQVAVILPRSGSRYKLISPDVKPSVPVPVPVPPEVNWDMWCGPAPLIDYVGSLSGGDRWDFGGGTLTNWGGHHIDIGSWGIFSGSEKATGPLTIEAEGYCPDLNKLERRGQFMPVAVKLEYPDDIDMWIMSPYPTVQELKEMDSETLEIINHIYRNVPDNIRAYDVNNPDPGNHFERGGVLFIGESGSVFVGRHTVVSNEIVGEISNVPIGATDFRLKSSPDSLRWFHCLQAHTIDFLKCVQTRQQPISNVFEQHYSQLPMHLANIALRCGRKLEWDAKAERFVNDAEANGLIKYDQREPYQIV